MAKNHDPPAGAKPVEPTTFTTTPIDCRKERSRRSKTKFACGFCGLACWAKPTASIVCGSCGIKMLPAEASSS